MPKILNFDLPFKTCTNGDLAGQIQHCENWNLTWFTDGSKSSNDTWAGIWGVASRYDASLWLGGFAFVFQAAICGIIKENLRRIYVGRTILILADTHATLRTVENTLSYWVTTTMILWGGYRYSKRSWATKLVTNLNTVSSLSSKLLCLSRTQLRQATGLLTDQCSLRKHLHIMGILTTNSGTISPVKIWSNMVD